MIQVLVYIQRAVDLLMRPFDALGPAWGILVSSVVVTALGLLVYKYTSNQDGIKIAKDKIKAHFFEVWIYLDDLRLIALAQGGIFKEGGRYLAYALVPLVVMLVPVMLILINLEFRYDYRPFRPGDEFLLKVRLKGFGESQLNKLTLELPEGLEVAAGAVRIAEHNPSEGSALIEGDWRLRVKQVGSLPLQFKLGQELIAAQIVFADLSGRPRLDPVKPSGVWASIWHPPLQPLPANSPIQEISVAYPQAEISFFGWKAWWIWPFLVVMFAAAFLLRGFIGVEF